MSAETLIEHAALAGVQLSLVDGRIRVSGDAAAVTGLVEHLRANKAELLEHFAAAIDPDHWRGLAAAYYAHHFTCPNCQAAGRGGSYGQRCGIGLPLWTAYQAAI